MIRTIRVLMHAMWWRIVKASIECKKTINKRHSWWGF